MMEGAGGRLSVRHLFDAGAERYDSARRRLVPCFDAFYGTAVEIVPFPADAPLRVLDLGAGTGLFSAILARAFPRATFTLVDVAPAMLDRAAQRFAAEPERFHRLTLDYARETLPGRYDVIASALSIHHLEDDQKRALFHRLHDALDPGGAFVNADQVAGPTPALTRQYLAAWRRQARAAGAGDDDLRAGEERMQADRPAPLDAQLAWLRAAGFHDVDCYFKHFMFAVCAGFR